jgi:hypothetical protein
MGKVAKGEKQEKKKKNKVFLYVLKFLCWRAWNQKKLSIGA